MDGGCTVIALRISLGDTKAILDQYLRFARGNQRVFSKPVVVGLTMEVGPEGNPTIHFFGDKFLGPEGYRTPIYEQILDEKEGKLRLAVELLGVEKEGVQMSALEDRVTVTSEVENPKYRAETPSKREIDPESGKATCKNGLPDVNFALREKPNSRYRRVRIV